MEFATQIYILGGSLGGALVLIGLMILVLVIQITSLKERLAEATKSNQGETMPPSHQENKRNDLEELGYNMYSGAQPKSSPALNSQLSVQSEMFRGGEEQGRWVTAGQ